MKRVGMLLCLLLAGCGYVPSEGNLVGTWQLEWRAPKKMFYTFHKDHTHAQTFAGAVGEIQGTWRLDGNLLTMTSRSFAVGGKASTLPPVPGSSSQESTVVLKLTDSVMVWRSGVLGGELTLKRVKSPPPPRPAVAGP